MTDEELAFREDLAEKSKIAKSARRGGRKSARPRINHYTKKELAKMNGPVHTVRMDEPIAYEDFKRLPDSAKSAYLSELVAGYRVGSSAISDMLGIDMGYCSRILKSLGIAPHRYPSREDVRVFKAKFCKKKETDTELAPASISIAPELRVSAFTYNFSGAYAPETLLRFLSSQLATGQEVRINISVEIIAK
jgi:hypothetical protein